MKTTSYDSNFRFLLISFKKRFYQNLSHLIQGVA